MIAVSDSDAASDPSATICAAPNVLPAGQIVAYAVEPGHAGTQAFDGVLGMDFEIANPVLVTHLGVFDDGSDGLARTLTAVLWDTTDPSAPTELARMDFSPEDPGDLINGSRFKALATPIMLETGFQGTISAEGYGDEEKLLNPGGDPAVDRPWSVNSGAGSIRFTGVGRYGTIPGEYPDAPDGGAPDRYGAGTFQYQTTELTHPGIVDVVAGRGDLAVLLTWEPVAEPVPAAMYRVYRSEAGGDPAQIAETSTPSFADEGLTEGTEYCYTVAGVTAAGAVGARSAQACAGAEARKPGVAYVVEQGAIGSQAFGGALGMDFDVLQPIVITRLGVFDDSSDGLFLPLTAKLYNRGTEELLATLEFTPEDAGELIDGSRFKDLATPVTLSPGFQGVIVASGYGDDERDGNGIDGRSVFSGAGLISFVGGGRYAVDPAAFPDVVDAGPENRYAAGTFYFEPAAASPQVTIAIARSAGGITLTWPGGGMLETAAVVSGPWTSVPGGASGGEIPTSVATAFYRVRQ